MLLKLHHLHSIIRIKMKNGGKVIVVEVDPVVLENVGDVGEVLVLLTRFTQFNVIQIKNIVDGPKASLEDPGKHGNIIKISKMNKMNKRN